MKITWDEPKRLANLEKHGIDLDASFLESAIALSAKPSTTGRERFRLIGEMNGVLIVAAIVSPLGTEAISVISLRPASKEERELYGS
jgi:uncharacterized DUF497 family protein